MPNLSLEPTAYGLRPSVSAPQLGRAQHLPGVELFSVKDGMAVDVRSDKGEVDGFATFKTECDLPV